MTRKEIREEINARPITDFYRLERSKSGLYCCPICGSGKGRNKSGALDIKNNRVMCYANLCFSEKGEDTLGALRVLWHCSEDEAIERAGYSFADKDHITPPKTKPTATAHEKPITVDPITYADKTANFNRYHEALINNAEALAYFTGRGLTRETIDRYNLGYAADFVGGPRFVIPCGKDRAKYRAAGKQEPKYINQKGENSKRLFNGEALDLYRDNKDTTPFIIVEGELDALSLLQMGFKRVIAAGGTSGINTLLDQAIEKAPEAAFLFCFDNDEPGEKANASAVDLFKAKGLFARAADPAELYGKDITCKDANEALIKCQQKFKDRLVMTVARVIQEAEDHRQAEEEKRYALTGPGMVDAFLQRIQAETYKPETTGIKSLDRILGGGLTRKTLTVLLAAPGMGKTTLAQQITETMARNGANVLYFNLEMARDQLIAKSLSRIAFTERINGSLTAADIMRGYGWSNEQRTKIQCAADIYKKQIAPRVIYNPLEETGNGTDIDAILQAAEAEAVRLEADGKAAPVLVVDYLQIITGAKREDSIDLIKRALTLLKDHAKRHNTFVIVLSATNREANRSGTADLNSGRDTSNIEYTADYVLTLSPEAVEHGEMTYADYRLAKRTGTLSAGDEKILLKLEKNRLGESNKETAFYFNGASSIFLDAAAPWEEERTKTRW